MSTTQADRAAIRARLRIVDYGNATEAERTLVEDLAALLSDVEQLEQELTGRDAEIDHWVRRYNELEAWRAQTSVLKAKAEARADALAQQVETLRAALREVERHCPCGARPESLHTHPHVTRCPVGAALGAQA